MSSQATQPSHVEYLVDQSVIRVLVSDAHQRQAVESFARSNGFTCPVQRQPFDRLNVYICSAKTHPNNEVLWA